MRAHGLWHAELVQSIVSLRHHDTLVICDAGFPVADHARIIDLGWSRGEPRVLPVLSAVLEELVVERATIAEEANDEQFLAGVQAQLRGVPLHRANHDDIKAGAKSARVIVRTGDDTPYANVMVHAGVPFENSQLPTRHGRSR